ncbi:MAG: efflux RND transporter periplasmic adaptor subunit [Alphaproteobacteria bacterium]|nr:efflux RND transporter periplasmic adaptor subunit [Alphaproteobacteria bacterium]
MKKIWEFIKRRKWWISAVVIAIITAIAIFSGSGNKSENQFATLPITKGDLKQVVTATGEIRPLNTIKVGSQVSGNIEKIYVDFNDKVTKGQVLLTIDPSVLQATVDEAKAALDSAEAQLRFDRAEYNRNRMLFTDGYIAKSELEQAETRFKTSEQSVLRARSQHERAVTNLGYATITSPVDGIVISRKVDKGQTVAASFQAPELFEIAEDLSQMKIETNVSEADIGMIREGQVVTFTVDAYPNQTFNGDVRQIRLSPTTTSNVVVYTVVIDVDNSDMRLMPGMTAFVTIEVEKRTDVWKAQNSAFLLRSFEGIIPDAGDKRPREYLAIMRKGEKQPILVPYKRGLTSSTETEIISDDIQEGDRIITGRLGQRSNATGGQFGSRGGSMGGGGIGGGMGGGGMGGRGR